MTDPLMIDPLAGRRILVVEDEILIAMEIEGALKRLGCVIIGPVGKLESALQIARDETIDAAILDVNIRGGRTYPVAKVLLARDIPFILASGYGDWALPEALQGQPRLTKPFRSDDVVKAVRAICL